MSSLHIIARASRLASLAALGAALAACGLVPKEPIIFEEKAGLVQLDLLKDGGVVVGARLNPPQPLRRGPTMAPDIVATACSLEADDVATANHAPCLVSCGVGFVCAELKTRAALATKSQPDKRKPSCGRCSCGR